MPGGRGSSHTSNYTTEKEWLFIDLVGVFFTLIVVMGFMYLALGWLSSLFSFNFFVWVSPEAVLILSVAMAVILVFVFRINLIVVGGERRSFRYFCRWI